MQKIHRAITTVLFLALLLLPALRGQITPPPNGGGGGGAPSGPAGGVLSGTYPNPGLASSVALPGSPTTTTPASNDNSAKIPTTSFVQGLIASLNQAVAVEAATVAVLPNTPTYSNGTAGVGATLTAGSNAALVVDGYTVLLNDRVLVNNQASAIQNGVYTVSTLGTGSVPYVLTRAADFNTPAQINTSGAIPVLNGTVNNNSLWVLNVAIATIGTDAINYNLGSTTPFPVLTITNAASTGTTVNKLAKLTGAPSTAVINNTADTTGAIGICVLNCGTTGAAVIQESGVGTLVFDNATTAGDFVQISATTAGDGHDAGAAFPSSGQVVGRVLTSNPSSNGPRSVLLFSPDIVVQAAQKDFADVKVIPAANCVAGTAGAGWSTASSNFTAACRAGSNNLTGSMQAIPSTGAAAQFMLELPKDWDTATQPYINIFYASGANTSGTVIWTVSSACTKEDGSVSDDPAFNAESAFGTQTMAAANRSWAQNGHFTAITSGNNCIAGSPVIVKVAVSGTASSNINAYQAVVTIPRVVTVQAN